MQILYAKSALAIHPNMWFRRLLPSEKVRISSLEERVSAVEEILQKNAKERRELLEVAESLDRITKRSFRLKEQLKALELDKESRDETLETPEVTRAKLLQRFGGRGR